MDFTQLRYRHRETYHEAIKNGQLHLGTLRTRKYSDNSIVATTEVNTGLSQTIATLERTWDQINPGPPYRDGGQFVNIKAQLPKAELLGEGIYRRNPNISPVYYVEYTGGFIHTSWPSDPVPESNYIRVGWDSPVNPLLIPHVSSDCSQVFSKLRPKLDKGSLGVAIAEAKDLPRMLQTSSRALHDAWRSAGGHANGLRMHPKTAADNFINHQFGWVPFLSDLSKFIDIYKNAGKYIAQISRDNGTWRKRKRTMRTAESERVLVRNTGSAGLVPTGLTYDQMCTPRIVNGQNTYGEHSITEHTSELEWAEGSFTFYHPDFAQTNRSTIDSMLSQLNQHLVIHGARINPSVVYKATPWSWLIDWFSNVGDVIDNANAMQFDRVVARYLYLMNHYVRKIVFQGNRFFTSGDMRVTSTRYVEVKQRQDASNPFDVCLGGKDLTARQLAILGALGISRYT